MIATGTHDPDLVVLSILVAAFASYTALDLGARVGVARGLARRVWLVAAAATMGGGIWSMHFVAMLAFKMPFAMSYDVGLTILSLVVAIFVTSGGFYVISRQSASPRRLVLSGIFMGLGIVAMHYTGMAALRSPADLSYDPLFVTLSIVVAIGASTAALWLTFRTTRLWQRLGAAAVTNAQACLNWLAGDPPNLEAARASAMSIVEDGTRAAEIISRTRLLFEKGSPRRELVDVNDVIREMIVLLSSEITRHGISVRTELASYLPRLMGDRVQLQQVLMNLIMNSVDAMKDVDETRELAIRSRQEDDGRLMVSVIDTGVGLPSQLAEQIFYAFFTTKPQGTGMGLSISRSIVESHNGRLWASDNAPRGACFHVVLPTVVETRE